jgi:hypothetical protein
MLAVFEWLENTGIGQAIRGSVWLFPVIEAFHLVALAALGGAVLLVDLRLFRAALKNQPATQVAEDARPWFLGSLAIILISGVLLFLSEAVKCYYSVAFWVKMSCLAAGILFALTVRAGFIRSGRAESSPALAKVVAAVSVLLWFGVAAGGRWIGFS